MSIPRELKACAKNGIILAEDVRAWALKHKGSEIYKSLEKDPTKGLHEYQLIQIRRMIRIHLIEPTGQRQFVSLSIDRKLPQGGYRAIDDVIDVPSLREVLLEDALTDFERMRAKYELVQELAGVWLEVSKVKTKQKTKKKTKEENQKETDPNSPSPA